MNRTSNPQNPVSSIEHPASSIQKPSSSLKGILFDFDGVVINSMEQHLVAWQYAFRKEGIHFDDLEFYLLEGRGVKEVVGDLCKKYDLPQELIPKLMETKIDYYDRHLKVEFYDGLLDLLEYLKSKDIKMALVTGGHRERVHPLVEKYFSGFFSAIVCSDDVENTKPFPEPYLKGIQMLRLKNNECLVIENAPLGIQAAKAAGVKVIAIETTLGKEYLKEADKIVQSFSEIQEIVKL